MERVTNHERPGVYSAYTATAAAQRGNRRGVAAVVAGSQKGTAGTLYALGSYRQAAETFGAEDGLTALVKILLANGAARVAALGGRVIPTTAIVAATLDSNWLVEIEAIAAA